MLDTVPADAWRAFTWLGDSALMLPLSLLLALGLWVSRDGRRAAFAWCLAFGAGGGLILLSKLAFMGWGIGSARWDFTGFSGHTAIGTSVWSVLLWLASARGSPRTRALAVGAGWCLGAAIGMSRLALHAHSVSEVVAGLLLGMAVSLCFLWLARRRAPPRLPWVAWLGGLLLPLLFLSPGRPAATQGVLEAMAIRLAGIERPFTRSDLQAL
ncbi:phosphatase PAP2 family protein [Variovorax sp. LT1R16]|uniref:phosphatase PAP2 family protein n=1 Tax=Variovorax sp. LT1R16 TaxID=3443728 RepID=UPI003F467FCC